jgi:hypothetical protein
MKLLAALTIWNAPSSSSGKYHAEGETLRVHTNKVIGCVRRLCGVYRVSSNYRRKLVQAAYFHDMWKYGLVDDALGFYKSGGHTVRDHAEIAYTQLMARKPEVAKMCRVHMQQWGVGSESIWSGLMSGTQTDPAYVAGLILAMADYIMSRRGAEPTADEQKHVDEIRTALERQIKNIQEGGTQP